MVSPPNIYLRPPRRDSSSCVRRNGRLHLGHERKVERPKKYLGCLLLWTRRPPFLCDTDILRSGVRNCQTKDASMLVLLSEKKTKLEQHKRNLLLQRGVRVKSNIYCAIHTSRPPHSLTTRDTTPFDTFLTFTFFENEKEKGGKRRGGGVTKRFWKDGRRG